MNWLPQQTKVRLPTSHPELIKTFNKQNSESVKSNFMNMGVDASDPQVSVMCELWSGFSFISSIGIPFMELNSINQII